MEALAPELGFLLDLKMGLDCGKCCRELVEEHINNHNNDFSFVLSSWRYQIDRGDFGNGFLDSENLNFNNSKESALEKNRTLSSCKNFSFHHQMIFELIVSSQKGEPIYERLIEVEKEIRRSCGNQVENFISRLSLLSLIPLVGFMFPAFLILLFGPLVTQLILQLGR